MTLSQSEWHELEALDGGALKEALFSVLQATAIEIQEEDADNRSILATVPRIADLIATRSELASFTESLGSLARSVGLWNYLDKESADSRDKLVAETVTIAELGNITLHREQIAALNVLLSGRNLILSAPTSFGKSILIDAMLVSGSYRRVAVVLPTIALLDEVRRRLATRFGDTFDVLMHQSDRAEKDRVIVLGTQERLINRNDLRILDLVVVDEFYKLDPARKDERSVTLNAAVYQLLRKSRQFFFLGQISRRFKFLRTAAGNVISSRRASQPSQSIPMISKVLATKRIGLNWRHTTPKLAGLVFVSSPDKANAVATMLAEGNHAAG